MIFLFDFIQIGDIVFVNCIVMVLLMCNWVEKGYVFGLLMVEYYCQCVSVGLIIVEVIQISLMVQGYFDILGIYMLEQVVGWCKVIDVVYVEGGKIVL